MSFHYSCIHFSFYFFFNAFPPKITLGSWHGVGWGVFICGHGHRAKKWRTVGQKVTYSGPKCDVRGAEKWRTGQNATSECYNEYLNTTKGIKVGNIRFSHLFFADDLILASETSSGLQKLIAGLQEFSKQWQSTFQKRAYQLSMRNTKSETTYIKFYYFNNEISEANDYDFLGITFSVKKSQI